MMKHAGRYVMTSETDAARELLEEVHRTIGSSDQKRPAVGVGLAGTRDPRARRGARSPSRDAHHRASLCTHTGLPATVASARRARAVRQGSRRSGVPVRAAAGGVQRAIESGQDRDNSTVNGDPRFPLAPVSSSARHGDSQPVGGARMQARSRRPPRRSRFCSTRRSWTG